MGMPENEKKFFICYPRKDAEFVIALVKDLKRTGIDVWTDQLDIPAGVGYHFRGAAIWTT